MITQIFKQGRLHNLTTFFKKDKTNNKTLTQKNLLILLTKESNCHILIFKQLNKCNILLYLKNSY